MNLFFWLGSEEEDEISPPTHTHEANETLMLSMGVSPSEIAMWKEITR